MKSSARIYGLVAAALFGASAPFSKLILDEVTPLQLAGLLYLGSGISLLLVKVVRWVAGTKTASAPIGKPDVPWLVAAVICGGVFAPIALMSGLSRTPAATASILLNFEAAATAFIAAAIFREHIGRKVVAALICLTVASLILTFDSGGRLGVSWGSLLIVAACVFWGFDNNFTRHISSKDPFTIVIIKGIAAGLFSVVVSLLLGERLPGPLSVGSGLALGALSYGASLILFILTLKDIGASRAGALFASAPFIGAAISLMIFRNAPAKSFILSVPLMLAGTVLLFRESHMHLHTHEPVEHEHAHRHDDGHHTHTHAGSAEPGRVHSHRHSHDGAVHAHNHMPDIHHRHRHG